MVKLESLTIRRYRSLEPATLYFHDNRNVVLGRNGTGKTTLLNLISIVLRSEFAEISTEEYDISFRIKISSEVIEGDVSNSKVKEPLRLLDGNIAKHSLETHYEQSYEQKIVYRFFEGEKLLGQCLRQADKFETDMAIPENVKPFVDKWQYMCLHVFKGEARFTMVPRSTRFDEGLDYYRFLFEGSLTRPQTSLKPDGSGSMSNAHFFPSELIGIIFRDSVGKSTIEASDQDLPFLKSLGEHMGFVQAKYSLDAIERRSSESDSGLTVTTYSNIRAQFFWDDQNFVSNGQLSYGQKRLLSLIHYIACNQDFIVADELVNGLHHEWIQYCLEECKTRQVFITSQNPLLFDYLSFESPEEIQRQFVLCSHVALKEGRPKMRWDQMSDQKARDFFGAYERGIQYISEILQTEGLW